MLAILCYCIPTLYDGLPVKNDLILVEAYRIVLPFVRLAFIVATAFSAAWWCNFHVPAKPSRKFLVSAFSVAIAMSLLLSVGHGISGPVSVPANYHGMFNSDLVVISPLFLRTQWWRPLVGASVGRFPEILITTLFAAAAYTLFAKRAQRLSNVEPA
jgi:hypothetical protein